MQPTRLAPRARAGPALPARPGSGLVASRPRGRQWPRAAAGGGANAEPQPEAPPAAAPPAADGAPGAGGGPAPPLPKRGFFSIADPKAEVRPPPPAAAGRAGAAAARAANPGAHAALPLRPPSHPPDPSLPTNPRQVYSKAGEAFDPAKKPDRYKPEFIWNTNWQEQLKLQEDLERQRREFLARQKAGEGGDGKPAKGVRRAGGSGIQGGSRGVGGRAGGRRRRRR
jgi:hypothetical protein